MEFESDFSKRALLAFVDMLEKGGLAKSNTAAGYRAAAQKVLSELSPQEEADVRKLDVTVAVRRYNNKNPGVLSPSSLGAYQRRVEGLIREFEKYHADPTSYAGIGREAASPNNRTKTDKGGKKAARELPEPGPPRLVTSEEVVARKSGLFLDFPLRENFLAQVTVPRDLKTSEARRLCAFVMALAVDYEPKAD